jgi:hypothetical protein
MQRRVRAIVAALGMRDRGPSDLYLTLVHAYAAQRRRHDALAAIAATAAGTEEDAGIRASGDSTMAVMSLYLAASAAQRFCTENDETPPFPKLDQLVKVTRPFRDAVMHWDDKVARDPHTFIAFSDRDVTVLAPPPPRVEGPSIAAGIEWAEISDKSSRLERWARSRLGTPVVDHLPAPASGENPQESDAG